jgi:hypothetical protein
VDAELRSKQEAFDKQYETVKMLLENVQRKNVGQAPSLMFQDETQGCLHAGGANPSFGDVGGRTARLLCSSSRGHCHFGKRHSQVGLKRLSAELFAGSFESSLLIAMLASMAGVEPPRYAASAPQAAGVSTDR